MLSEGRVWRIHTHTLHFPPAFVNISRHSYPSVILIPLFLCLFVSTFDTNRLRGESSFRPEPIRTPPHGPSRVDIQFLNESLKIYTYTPLESPKDHQGFFLQGFDEVRQPKEDDGKIFLDSKLEKPSAILVPRASRLNLFPDHVTKKRRALGTRMIFSRKEIKMLHMRRSVSQSKSL